MKLTLIKSLGLAAVLTSVPVTALAVTTPVATPPPGSVLSDFATDVNQGLAQLKTDPAAQASHNEVEATENQVGNVDDGQVSVDQDIQESESTESNDEHQADSQDEVDKNGDIKQDSSSGSSDSHSGSDKSDSGQSHGGGQ